MRVPGGPKDVIVSGAVGAHKCVCGVRCQRWQVIPCGVVCTRGACGGGAGGAGRDRCMKGATGGDLLRGRTRRRVARNGRENLGGGVTTKGGGEVDCDCGGSGGQAGDEGEAVGGGGGVNDAMYNDDEGVGGGCAEGGGAEWEGGLVGGRRVVGMWEMVMGKMPSGGVGVGLGMLRAIEHLEMR